LKKKRIKKENIKKEEKEKKEKKKVTNSLGLELRFLRTYIFPITSC
jgi:hypothetical protein